MERQQDRTYISEVRDSDVRVRDEVIFMPVEYKQLFYTTQHPVHNNVQQRSTFFCPIFNTKIIEYASIIPFKN